MKTQNGYTLVEIILVPVYLAIIGLISFGLYAAIHFILKFW